MKTKYTQISLLFLAIFLTGCSMIPIEVTIKKREPVAVAQVQETEPTDIIPQPTASPTATSIPATVTTAPTVTLPPTLTFTPTPKTCLSLHYPPDGEWVRAYGYLAFNWEPWLGAASYRLEITVPNGWVMEVDADCNVHDRYMQTLPTEGEYSWRVSALDPEGQVICTSETFTFKKQQSRADIGGGGQTCDDVLITGS